jgi:hypothetical protein
MKRNGRDTNCNNISVYHEGDLISLKALPQDAYY